MVTIPLAAEVVFSIGNLPVSNAMVSAWIALFVFLLVALLLRRPRLVPGRFQGCVETILEGLLSLFDRVTQNREKSKKFLPIIGTFFLFILLCNWMGLLPGFGSIGVWHTIGEKREFVPLFRSANSDLNLTLAMALISVIGSHALGIATFGILKHGNKFIQLGTIWRALKTLNPIKIVTALIEFLVGFIEIFSEIAKIASLSLRLFGNVFAGEVLLTVMASLAAYLLPLPFIALEILVGIVQATVFSMLSLVYFTVMSTPPHGERDAHEKRQERVGMRGDLASLGDGIPAHS